MGKPHKHAEVIKAWADGAEVQVYLEDSGTWVDLNETIYWHEVLRYRIKPELPKYPQTKMTDAELQYKMPVCTHEFTGYVRRVANAAIARAIDDKQVFTADSVKQALEAGVGCEMVPAAMLEKVVEAVRSELVTQVARYSTGCSTYINGEIDLASIVKRVKEGKP